MSIRTYSELITLPTFEERYRYLQLNGKIGEVTFGSHRYLYESFLKSGLWLSIRDEVILRDCGCDLAMPDREIQGRIIVHHMNPVTVYDLVNKTDILLNPEYMISTSHITHEAITYGDEGLLIKDPIERRKNDTCPWRHD